MSALPTDDDPLAAQSPLATGYAMPGYLQGPAPVKAAPNAAPKAPDAGLSSLPGAAAPAAATPTAPVSRTQTPDRMASPVYSQVTAAVPGGYSPTGLARTIQIESGGNPNAGAGTSHQGLGQFSSSTWASFGHGSITDPQQSLLATQRYAAANAPLLTRALGRAPTDAELYLAHQQGPGGAIKLLMNPNVRAGSLVGDAAIAGNGGDPNAPASAFTSKWAAKFGLTGYANIGAGTAARNYAMPAGTSGEPAPVEQPAQPAQPAEAKKYDLGKLDLGEGDKKYDLSKLDLTEGAKNVEGEAGAQEEGFLKRAYDKLTGGVTAARAGIGLAGDIAKAYVPGLGTAAKTIGDNLPQGTPIENVEGLAAGAAENVTGLGEYLGGDVGKAAGRGTDYLETIGDPNSRTTGRLAAPFALGGMGALTKGARLAEEAAPVVLSYGQKAAKAARDAAVGFGWGTATPVGGVDPKTGEEKEWEQRATEKIPYQVLGVAASPLATAGREVRDLWKGYRGSVEKAASTMPETEAETLRGEVRGVRKDIATKEQAAAEALTPKQAALEKDLSYMNEQVEKAQKEAEKSGLSKEEATKYAENQKQDLERAQKTADEFVAKFADRKSVPPEDISENLTRAMAKDYEAGKKARKAKVDFEGAVNADKGKPSIPTKDFVDRLDALEKDTKSQELKAAIPELKKALQTDGKPAVSIRNAREIIVDANSALEAMSPSARERLQPIVEDLLKHMETVHPDMEKARLAYAKESRYLDPYERGGAGAKALGMDLYSKEPLLDSTKTIGAIIAKGEKGAELMGRLAKQDEGVKADLEKYLNGQLFGFGGAAKTPTAAAFSKFVNDYRLVIDKAGLTEKFATPAEAYRNMTANVKAAKESVDAAEKARLDAEKAAAKAEKASRSTEQRAETTQAAVKELAEQKAKHEAIVEAQRKFDDIFKDPKHVLPSDIAARTREEAESLFLDGHITNEQRAKLVSASRDLDQKFANRADAQKAIAEVERSIRNTLIASAAYGTIAGIGGHIYLRNIPERLGH